MDEAVCNLCIIVMTKYERKIKHGEPCFDVRIILRDRQTPG
jgi:hypothetical protein